MLRSLFSDWLMLKRVECDWLMNLRGTGYRFDKTIYFKRRKQNNDGWCLFLIMQRKTDLSKILTIIFEGELFPLSSVYEGHRQKILVWSTDLNQ